MPPVFHRLARCKRRDVKAFVHLFDTLFPEDGSGVAEKPSHSAVLQRQIAYSDLWDHGSDPEALQTFLDDAVAVTGVSASFSEWAATWPVGPIDPEAGRFAEPPLVPVLLLHGGYDASIALPVAEAYATAWPDAGWVPVPYAHHVAFNAGACPQSIMERFVADPGADLDTSCAAEMEPPSFAADATADLALWGVDDRWGDACGGCRHASLPAGAIGLLVAMFTRSRTEAGTAARPQPPTASTPAGRPSAIAPAR